MKIPNGRCEESQSVYTGMGLVAYQMEAATSFRLVDIEADRFYGRYGGAVSGSDSEVLNATVAATPTVVAPSSVPVEWK